MSKCHVFSVDDAVQYGVEKAVILQNIRFWLEKVKANDKDEHKHDGYYWTYNSARAFAEIFPYYNKSKVHRLLTQLEEDGVIISGNFNKAGYDRTKWYSMPEFSISDNCNTQIAEVQNGNSESATPIPYVITDINPDVNHTIVTEKSEADLLVDFWNDNRPPSAAVKKEVWSKIIKTRLKTFSADEIKTAMLTVINSQWHQQNKQVLIKNAIDSDKRCAEAIEKSSQPQQTNYQGNNHENHQSANSQPKQSSADVYAAKLAEQRRQREAANTTATGSDRANVYDMEETF